MTMDADNGGRRPLGLSSTCWAAPEREDIDYDDLLECRALPR